MRNAAKVQEADSLAEVEKKFARYKSRPKVVLRPLRAQWNSAHKRAAWHAAPCLAPLRHGDSPLSLRCRHAAHSPIFRTSPL